jgi:hypothetical protein
LEKKVADCLLPSQPMTDSPEVGALIAELERAWLVTIGRDAEGRETWTLTPEGATRGGSWRWTRTPGRQVISKRGGQ